MREHRELRLSRESQWQPTNLLRAPHRLGFFLALVVLIASGAWWTLVQVDRVTGVFGWPYALAPSLVHGAVMTFGFFPLLFDGFLFTAGPKWLQVQGPKAEQLQRPLGVQTVGWLLWVTGSHSSEEVSLLGLTLALAGQIWTTLLFYKLVQKSNVEDKLHAHSVVFASVIGCLSVAGLLLNVVRGADEAARACTLSGLWGFVLLIFVTVAHRMLPFFTSSAMPFFGSNHPFWALRLMQSIAAFELLSAWVEAIRPMPHGISTVFPIARGALELLAGFLLLWLSIAWGLMQSLKNRLLAMLHTGFLWFGLAMAIGGAGQLLSWVHGEPLLPLGQLHALTMGCLASLMLAMVTRVACGHSGRALVADSTVWSVFLALQVATLLRIAGALPMAFGSMILLSAAVLWFVIALVWGLRLIGWFGRLRPDGRPG